jgi:hypothetical protein
LESAANLVFDMKSENAPRTIRAAGKELQNAR